MTIDSQTAATLTIVALAGLYLLRRSWRSWSGTSVGGCGGCTGCAAESREIKPPLVTLDTSGGSDGSR